MIPGFLILATLHVSGFAGADLRSANITRGSIVNPEPIQCFTGGLAGRLGEDADPVGANALGIRVWTCNHLTAVRDHQMPRCFNETDPSLYFRNRYEFVPGWTMMSETGPTWVLYRPFKGENETHQEVEWRVRLELETPWVTPYGFLRETFNPYSLTYWQTGLKRRCHVSESFKATPFVFLDWGDDELFAFKYGESQGRIPSGVSAIDAGCRLDWSVADWFSVWGQVDGYWIVNQRARRANRERSSITSRNEIAVFSLGIEFRF